MNTRGILLPLLVVLCPCSGDDEVSASSFLVDYPEAYCDYSTRCCSSNEREYNSSTVCLNKRTAEAEALLGFATAETPFATFDVAQAQACLDGLRNSDCVKATAARECLLEVAVPQHKPGETCSYPAECSTYHCVQAQAGTPGTCAAGSGSCSGDDRACGASSYCDGTRQCLAKKDLGQTCGRSAECLSGLCALQLASCVAAPAPLCDGK